MMSFWSAWRLASSTSVQVPIQRMIVPSALRIGLARPIVQR